jgi:hypothetical protein
VTWHKAPAAAQYCGGVATKTLYAAVQRGDLKAARIGAGRNLLFCETWLDAWLIGRAQPGDDSPHQPAGSPSRPPVPPPDRGAGR